MHNDRLNAFDERHEAKAAQIERAVSPAIRSARDPT